MALANFDNGDAGANIRASLNSVFDVALTPFIQSRGFDLPVNAVTVHLGAIWTANDVIPDTTAFAEGTTGATFTRISFAASAMPDNIVVVKEASQMSGVLLSTVTYDIDGGVDMGTTEIDIPVGGLHIRGANMETCGLYSSENSYTMFNFPGGGSGSLFVMDLYITASGTGSAVYNLEGATGTEAIELIRVNYNSCTSLGTIKGYRQGFETGTGRFGGTPSLILDGAWNGFRITASLARGIDNAMTEPLFKAGGTFTMANRFLTDINVDLGTTAPLLDFSSSNFTNTDTLQIHDAIITRGGVLNPEDLTITPNIDETELAANFKGNVGLHNTHTGGELELTTEVLTPLTQNVFTDMLGTFTPTDLQHFDVPAAGQLRLLSASPSAFQCILDYTIESTANDILQLRLVIDRFGGSDEVIKTITKQVDALSGARDVARFSRVVNVNMKQGDIARIQITNTSSNDDATAEYDSYHIIQTRN